jgi:hypothetical protein
MSRPDDGSGQQDPEPWVPEQSRSELASNRRADGSRWSKRHEEEPMSTMPLAPWGTEWPSEVPVRDAHGRPMVLRVWPERGRVALACGPGEPVYVDLAHTGTLMSLLSASAHGAAVLAATPPLPEPGAAGGDRG